MPESIFRDEDGDELTYWIESFDSSNQIPPWVKFIAGNRTLIGMPKDGVGTTKKLKIYVKDGREGVSYQILYLVINANYDLKRMIPLIVLGVFPLMGIFGFAFALAFVKVPPLGNEEILNSKEKIDFDILRMALEEQVRYKQKHNMMKE